MLYEDNNYLVHYGIKGQRWGIRRFQNKDGSLTQEGKERYLSEKSSKNFDKDSKSNDSVKKQICDGLDNCPSAFLQIGDTAIKKIRSGKVLTDKEIRDIQESTWNKFNNRDTNSLLLNKMQSTSDPIEKNKIKDQFREQDLAMDYAYGQLPAINRIQKYEESLSAITDERDIDPSYKTFSSKSEKAKAESEYLKRAWYDENGESLGAHIFDRVCNLSYDGYENVPKSKRMRSMFTYNGKLDDNDPYAQAWEPKSKNWDSLVEERRNIYKESGVKEAHDKYSEALKSQKVKDLRKDTNLKKLYKAYAKANEKLSKMMEPWQNKRNEFYKDFNEKIAKNVLLDLGYEITDSNLNLIKGIIWWD